MAVKALQAWTMIGLAALASPVAVRAGDAVPAARSHLLPGFVTDTIDWLHDGTTRLGALLGVRSHGGNARPDWLREQSWDGLDLHAPGLVDGSDSVQLVVQQDRRDGADLLTLRYPLATVGALHTYAGAGMNQAVYMVDSTDAAAELYPRRNHHRSMGAAAEFGAEVRLAPQLQLNADVRWIEIDPQADVLRTANGYVGADPVSVGLSLGWRFR